MSPPRDTDTPRNTNDALATPRLGDDDARLLDWMVEHGFDPASVDSLPEADRPRARALLRQMNVLDAYTVAPPHESLVDAVVARVTQFEADREAAMRMESAGRPKRGWRLADVLAIAAMLMLVAAVTLPMLSQVRASSLATVCANNMRAVGSGLGAYARDHEGSLPAMAGFGGLDTLFGKPTAAPQPQRIRGVIEPGPDGKATLIARLPSAGRHSASLTLLVTAGYCDMHSLQCPGCAQGTPCYAYRVPAEGQRFDLETVKPMVVVADANPVLELRLDGRRVESATMSSRNHGERGQNMLFNDGAVDWRVSPVLTIKPDAMYDNIWLPRGEDGREHTDMKGPARNPDDNFVAQ